MDGQHVGHSFENNLSMDKCKYKKTKSSSFDEDIPTRWMF